MSMLRGRGPAGCPGRRGRAARRRPGPARRPVRAHRRGRGAGADRRRVADAAAALPVAQLHHRRGPRPGPARVHRVVAGAARTRIGLDQVNLASLSINYRTPEEVMAEAEPVIRAVLPDANVPTSIRSSGVPVVHGSVSDLGAILDTWLAAHADGIACVIGDRARSDGDVPRPVADPRAVEGARVRPGRPRRPGGVRHGIEGAVDRYVAMTRATQQLVILRSSGARGAR